MNINNNLKPEKSDNFWLAWHSAANHCSIRFCVVSVLNNDAVEDEPGSFWYGKMVLWGKMQYAQVINVAKSDIQDEKVDLLPRGLQTTYFANW